jgi:capsular exopolysaccharide synthesis family protein
MVAESFRALRTNIQFKDTERQIRSIAITSTSPQEGKTIVAINLSITMAQAGMKILLVGSDLRKPMLAKVFGIETTPGLTDILLGNYPWRDTVKGVTDMILGKMTLDEVMMTPGMDNLHIITSGSIPSNPAELIDSSRLMDFMDEAKEEYDLIIFDSPPVLSAADPAILGRKVDGVLLLYRLGTVSRGLLKRSTSQLEQINCHIMGVILNGMRPEVSPDFHDYKYYRYYYSYGEEPKEKRSPGNKKRFSLGRKKEDNSLGPEGEIFPGSVGKDAQEKQGNKLNLFRFFLMGVAVVALTLGILWHNGIVDPFRLVNGERSVIVADIKAHVKKSLSSKPIHRKAKATSTKPKSAIFKSKPRIETEKAMPSSPLVAKAWAEIDTPASPVKILSDSTEGHNAESEMRVPPSPAVLEAWAKIDTPASPVKTLPDTTATPGLASKTPVPPSPLVTEPWAEIDTPASPSRIQSYPYSLQVGAFRSLDRTEKAISMYGRKGLSAYRIKVDLNEKGVWYRVFMGHFEDREQAERFKQEHGLKKSKVKEAPSFPAMAKDVAGMDTSVPPIEILSYSTENPKLEAGTPNPPSPLVAKDWAQVDAPASSIKILSDSAKVSGFEAKTPIPPSLLAAKGWAEIDTPASLLRILSDSAGKPRPEEETPVHFVRRRISKKAIARKPEATSTKLRAAISKKKPVIEPETPTAPSLLLAKAWAEVDTPSSPLKTSSYSYSIQLGAFRTLERAEKAISMYSEKGLSPYRVKADSNKKKVWYRVFTGHFEDRQEAERFKQTHGLKKSVVKKTGYANLIGTHTYGDELENLSLALVNLGYSPYIIKGHQGDSRLFVGAFSKKADAERQGTQLKLNGIHSEVVHR